VFVVKFLVYFIIATIPLLFAAVQPWVWSVYSVIIFTAFLITLWQGGSPRVLVLNKVFIFTIVFFFIITLCQYIAFPQFILSILSPFRLDALLSSTELINHPLSWVPLSYSPLYSFTWWIFLLSAFLFFFVLREFCGSRKSLKLLVGIMVGLAIAEAIYGLIQALIPSLGVLWVDYVQAYMGDARGTYINRNHFAGFIEMVWPLALGLTLALGFRGKEIDLRKLIASDQFNKQILLVLGMVVMLLALLLSRSRAGITGAFIGLFTFILLIRFSQKRLPFGF